MLRLLRAQGKNHRTQTPRAMATLIPAISRCADRMTSGERRLAERLEKQLDDDYLIWYDVPIGPKQAHPDFVILHPRRGILVLEVKDWHRNTILPGADRHEWRISADGIPKTVVNPLAQARHYVIQVVNALERDPQLVQAQGPHEGKLAFPWGYGVVFTRITRKDFVSSELDQAIAPHCIICSDEMLEDGDPEVFQRRLWGMFPHSFSHVLSLPQIDRIRWHLFPDVRVPIQASLFTDEDIDAPLPDVMRVMDLQQEQLARSLGDGHRVIHGVAGSGKTMILGFRAEFLANARGDASKPVLVLCYNEPLAVKLAASFEAKGMSAHVHVRHFHSWCRKQLKTYGQPIPQKSNEGQQALDELFEAMVQNVIHGVDRKQIPSGQYRAVLIDEGHDFKPQWLKLVTQMVDPTTNSLLVLYDDAQSIYERRHTKQFSFKSVGIQAQGRTTILKINYRNTKQILAVANRVAGELLAPDEMDDDGVPLIRPVGCGREGEQPLIIRLPSMQAEAQKLAELLKSSRQQGYAWNDMGILCPDHRTMRICSQELTKHGMPHQVRFKTGDFDPSVDNIRVMTMHASKGLEFPIVALAGAGHIRSEDAEGRDAARLFYVAATRATSRLFITISGGGILASRLETAGDRAKQSERR
jgi:hypothetical protein